MPTSGSASYSGQSILAIDITESDEDDYHIGNSQFSVDFGNKSLSGSLGINNIQYEILMHLFQVTILVDMQILLYYHRQ